MASTLFKALENIDKGRLECIRAAQTNGVSIDDNASLQELADKAFVDIVYNNNNTTNIPELVYPYTFDTDPTVWRRPTEWPDIESIFRTYEDDGYLAPKFICLLKNPSAKTSIGHSDGSLVVGPWGYQYGFNWSYPDHKIILSDGTEYTLEGSRPALPAIVHEWDTSKDIVDSEGNVYRWILVYHEVATNMKHNANKGGIILNGGLEVVEVVSVYNHAIQTTNSNLQRFKVTRAWTPKQLELCAECDTTSGNIIPQTNSNFKEWVLDSDDTHLYAHQNQVRYGNCIVEHTAATSPVFGTDYNGNADYSYWSNFITKIPVILRLPMPHKIGQNYYVYPIKYIEGPVQFDSTCLELSGYRGLNFDKFTEIRGIKGDYALSGLFSNKHYVDLSNLANVTQYCFANNGADIINLNGLTLINAKDVFVNLYCRKLYLDNVASITAAQIMPYGLVELNLPALTNLSADFRHGGDRYGGTVSVVRVPKLTTLTSGNAFNGLTNLQWLELPQDFQYSLNLTNCARLRPECILDIINKMGTTTAGLSITLAPTIKIPDEWKTMASEKGWVIK